MTIKEEAKKYIEQRTEFYNEEKAFIAGTNCEAVQELVKTLESLYSMELLRSGGVISQPMLEIEKALEAWRKANE